MRTLQLPVGVGMFGKAVADRRVVVTGDYVADERFVHADATDSFVDEIGIRSMVVAPLTAGDEVFGALGTFSQHRRTRSRRPRSRSSAPCPTTRRFAMANARLIEELARSREAIERQAPRSSARCASSAPGSPAPATRARSSSTRSTRRSGCSTATARGSTSSTPRSACCAACTRRARSRSSRPSGRAIPNDRLEVGASGRAVTTGQTYISRDYLTDENLVHGHGPDTYVRNEGHPRRHRHAAVRRPGPVRRDHGVVDQGGRVRPRSTPSLLETIAGQSAVALGRARLIEELGRSRETLARRAEEERALREIASRLGAMGDDPADILNRIVHEAARLLGGERARLDLIEPLSGALAVDVPAGDAVQRPDRRGRARRRRPGRAADRAGRARGPRGAAGRHRATTWRDTRFRALHGGRRGRHEVGLHSIIAAPVIGEEGLLGVLQAGAPRDATRSARTPRRLIAALAGPGGDRDHQRPARRPARVVAGRARADRGRRARAARDRPPDDDHPGPGGAPPGRRRRGGPAARLERRGHRPPRPGDRRGPLGVRRRHRRRDPRPSGRRAGVGGDGVFLAIRERRVDRDRRLRRRRAVRRRRPPSRLLRASRHPLDRVRAAHRRGRGAGHARGVRRRARPLRRRRRRRPSRRSPTSRRSRSTTRS